MKQVTLSQAERAELREAHKSARTHRERQRAHAVLLSAKGYCLNQLSNIFECDRDTISRWIDDWQTHGVAGLSDATKPGRPGKLNGEAVNFPRWNGQGDTSQTVQRREKKHGRDNRTQAVQPGMHPILSSI